MVVKGTPYESPEVSVTVLVYQVEDCFQCALDGGILPNVGHAEWRGLTPGLVYQACATDELERKLDIWLEFIEYDVAK